MPFHVGYNSDKRKGDRRIGTWNVRTMYRAGSVTTEARELARYKLDIVGVQEVRWDRWGRVRAGHYNFFSTEKETKIINWELSGSIKCGKFLV